MVNWALQRFLSESFGGELPDGIWEKIKKSDLLGPPVETAETGGPFTPETGPDGQPLDMWGLYRPEVFPNSPNLISAWQSLKEVAGYMGTDCSFSPRLEYSVEDLLSGDEAAEGEMSFSAVQAQEAADRFKLDDARAYFVGNAGARELDLLVVNMVSSWEEGTLPHPSIADLRSEFSRAGDEGRTARAQWMGQAFDVLREKGLCYLTFVSDRSRRPLFGLMSKERFGDRLQKVWELSECAMALSVRYDWDLSQATTFILRGDIPFSRSNRVLVAGAAGQPWPRFQIEVDADLPPAELSRMYIREREPYIKGFRSLGRKHKALAAFVGVINRDDNEEWTKKMESWNEWIQRHLPEDPSPAYSTLAFFKRDVARARERMLRPRPER